MRVGGGKETSLRRGVNEKRARQAESRPGGQAVRREGVRTRVQAYGAAAAARRRA